MQGYDLDTLVSCTVAQKWAFSGAKTGDIARDSAKMKAQAKPSPYCALRHNIIPLILARTCGETENNSKSEKIDLVEQSGYLGWSFFYQWDRETENHAVRQGQPSSFLSTLLEEHRGTQ